MPNAAASLDQDFGFQAPGRRGPARAAPRKKGKKTRRAGGAFFDKMPRYGAIAISVVIGVGIVVNALMMQHGHHPAPLFGGAAPDRPVAKLAVAVPAAKAETAAPLPVAQAAAADPVEVAAKPAAHSGPAKASRGEDAIARLIGGTPAAAHKSKAAAEKVAVAKLAAAKAGAGKAGQDRHRAKDE